LEGFGQLCRESLPRVIESLQTALADLEISE